jgi:hypothetical protein
LPRPFSKKKGKKMFALEGLATDKAASQLGSARYLNELESQLGSARYELELAR